MNVIKKISLIIIGFLISFLILEIVLQLTSTTMIIAQNYKNKESTKTEDVTILCLGESTTYNQWPPILQKILDVKSKHIKFNIIDKGKPGTNTSAIASNINQYMIKYKPDVVVIMTGINDTGIIYKDYPIKTLNLLYLLFKHIKYNFIYDYSSDMFFNIERQHFEYIQAKQFAKAEQKLLYLWNLSNHKSPRIYGRLFQLYMFWPKYEKCDELLKMNEIDIVDYLPRYLIEYLLKVKKYSKENIRDFLIANQKRLKCSTVEEISILLKQYECEEILEKLEKSEKFKDPLIKYEISYTTSQFKKTENYLKIITKIHKYNSNTIIIPMQYPSISVKKLQEELIKSKYYDKLLFISNEKNFKEALKIYKIEDIFKDMFGRSFGHCTELGNTLIAENVAETILKLYDKQ